MPDSTTPLLSELSAPDELLHVILEVSLTGFILFRPVYAPESHVITDLAYVRLNPAAQRMLGLPQQPAQTFLTLYPNARETGIFDFYRTSFETGEPGKYNVNYQHDQLDNYFHLAAQRSGSLLVVSFSDTADQDRSAVEQALRESQARERVARADAELQRRQLHTIFMQVPAMICIFDGPQHVFRLVNPSYQQLVGERPLLGLPIAEAMPKLAGQPIFSLLDEVYRTGESFHAQEMLVQFDHENSGELGGNYYNFIYQAIRNVQGAIEGVVVFAYEVTAQVRARYQVQDLNEELAAANEELQAANEEIRVAIAELQFSEQALLELNNNLESSVARRTQQVRAAQRAAEMQRARLERFFLQAPAAICMLDGPELVYELVNPAYEQLFPGRELLNRPILEALPEIADHAVYQTFRRVYDTGVTHQEQSLLIPIVNPASGLPEERYFNYIQQARYNEHGQIDGVLVFAFEVTAQEQGRQQNEALQAEVLASAQRMAQERETFYQVFEQTPASIVLLRGPQHRVEYYNQAYQELFPGREMHGRTIAEIQPDALAQGFVSLLDKVYTTGEIFYGNELQLLINQLDGQPPKVNHFNFTYQPYRENGTIVGISVFAYEVSEQVLARQQRERNERQLQLITDALPVLICYLDREEKYQFANQSYENWFLKEPSELLGLTVRQVVGEQAYAGIEKYIRRALAGERLDFEARMPYREDFVRYIHTSYVPEVQDGEVVGFYGMVMDITDQVESRQQVEALNEELAAINEEMHATNEELSDTNQQLIRTNVDLDNFIYTASHDLRAPIANIEGLLQALTYQLPTSIASEDQILPILGMMQGAVERFQKTIDHLTDVTKLQKEQVQPTQTVDLAAILAEVRLDLAPLMAATQAELRVEVGECPTISFSQKNLRSVVYNLLSNAFKYCHPDRAPRVLVRCRQTKGYAMLEVQDNGLGLDESQQVRLFGMFQRFHDHVDGTGIGLYMVKRMVENVGGRIQIQSEVGEGSTFIVFFPR